MLPFTTLWILSTSKSVQNIFLCRVLCTVCICLTLYGAGCVFIVLISQLVGSLMGAVGVDFTLCLWMLIVALALTPLTWMGSPKDFW